eukprot:245996_1
MAGTFYTCRDWDVSDNKHKQIWGEWEIQNMSIEFIDERDGTTGWHYNYGTESDQRTIQFMWGSEQTHANSVGGSWGFKQVFEAQASYQYSRAMREARSESVSISVPAQKKCRLKYTIARVKAETRCRREKYYKKSKKFIKYEYKTETEYFEMTLRDTYKEEKSL